MFRFKFKILVSTVILTLLIINSSWAITPDGRSTNTRRTHTLNYNVGNIGSRPTDNRPGTVRGTTGSTGSDQTGKRKTKEQLEAEEREREAIEKIRGGVVSFGKNLAIAALVVGAGVAGLVCAALAGGFLAGGVTATAILLAISINPSTQAAKKFNEEAIKISKKYDVPVNKVKQQLAKQISKSINKDKSCKLPTPASGACNVNFKITEIDNYITAHLDGEFLVSGDGEGWGGGNVSRNRYLRPGKHKVTLIVKNRGEGTPAGGFLTVSASGKKIRTMGIHQGGSYPVGMVFNKTTNIVVPPCNVTRNR